MTSSTGQTQQHSQLWSAAPRDWADNELLCTPVYEAVFDAVICAYTAYLWWRGECVEPTSPIVLSDGWIWFPRARVA